MADQLAGGWTGWNFSVDVEAKSVFDQALQNWVGVKYEPIAVATQVVAGTNYCFLSKGQIVYPGTTMDLLVKIYIFKPLPSTPLVTPFITEIERVTP